MNCVQLIGRLTKDVDLRFTGNGNAVGNFTLAVNRNFKNDQGGYDADFIRCTVWQKIAENLANMTVKGSRIGIEGRIQTGSYDNQQGERVYTTEVVVNNFHLLDSKADTDAMRRQNGNQGQDQQRGNQPNYQSRNNQGYQPPHNQQYQPKNQARNLMAKDMTEVHIPSEDLPF